MPKRDPNKPRGKMSSYAFFVQTCREEHKRKHPGESVVFAEFSRRCADKWKEMTAGEKKRFEDMAAKDKVRYDREMAKYEPTDGSGGKRKRKQKDPNAPKRALSAFFFFCGEERGGVKELHPNYTVGDIAKELGKAWEGCTSRAKYEKMAANDKARYEKEMITYKKGGVVPTKRSKPVVPDDDEEEEADDDEISGALNIDNQQPEEAEEEDDETVGDAEEARSELKEEVKGEVLVIQPECV